MSHQKSGVIVVICVLLGMALSTAQAQITGSGTTDYIPKFTGSTSIGNSVIYESSGLVGIGTTSPGSLLTVNGTIFSLGTSPEGIKLFTHATSHYGAVRTYTTNPGKVPLYFQQQDSAGIATSLSITSAGYVGIGTDGPSEKLQVVGTIHSTSGGYKFPDGTVQTSASGASGWIDSGNVVRLATATDKVGIGTTSPSKTLTVRGNILVERSDGTAVMELGEGLDYAEAFDVTDSATASPGTVLVIDGDHLGRLTTSTKRYDTRVAGIVAGAKNLGSGVRLGVGQFDCDVALAGRVYCNVDATECAVQAGDLLTTSNTPGYAMKATDPSLAHGAVLGKAMQRLERGQKGQILVLVTLQ